MALFRRIPGKGFLFAPAQNNICPLLFIFRGPPSFPSREILLGLSPSKACYRKNQDVFNGFFHHMGGFKKGKTYG